MKRILLFLAPAFLALALLAAPSRAQIASDTLDASARYYTLRIDSLLNLSTLTMRADSIFQADPKKFSYQTVVQLQIDVASSRGRTDTIIVKKRRLVAKMGGEYDTLWVPVPLMRLSTATVDTIGIVSLGPVGSQDGGSYRVESFLVYDAFMDGQPWRVERRSGKGHPIIPDASATHTLFFNYWRRLGYSGGGLK